MDIERYEQELTLALGRELKGAIAARGFTVVDVASRLGVERSTLSRYLNGKRQIPATLFVMAARMIGIEPGVLTTRARSRVDLLFPTIDLTIEGVHRDGEH